jgi:hypothetical protein
MKKFKYLDLPQYLFINMISYCCKQKFLYRFFIINMTRNILSWRGVAILGWPLFAALSCSRRSWMVHTLFKCPCNELKPLLSIQSSNSLFYLFKTKFRHHSNNQFTRALKTAWQTSTRDQLTMTLSDVDWLLITLDVVLLEDLSLQFVIVINTILTFVPHFSVLRT